MTALPITLESALNNQGYTIDVVEAAEFDIILPTGTLHIPAMARSVLAWRREDPPVLGDDLYLTTTPLFDAAYRPVLLSHILDRYRTRRLGYDTVGEWKLAYRRWGNLNMTIPNQRYRSAAVALPLDDRDETDTIEATRHGLDVGSDFPQSVISGNTDYATAATDRRQADNSTGRRTGRSTSLMKLLDEQRATYLNVDEEVLVGMEKLFYGIFDRGEGVPRAQFGLPGPYLDRMDWDHFG